jgi:hypothetical protein
MGAPVGQPGTGNDAVAPPEFDPTIPSPAVGSGSVPSYTPSSGGAKGTGSPAAVEPITPDIRAVTEPGLNWATPANSRGGSKGTGSAASRVQYTAMGTPIYSGKSYLNPSSTTSTNYSPLSSALGAGAAAGIGAGGSPSGSAVSPSGSAVSTLSDTGSNERGVGLTSSSWG